MVGITQLSTGEWVISGLTHDGKSEIDIPLTLKFSGSPHLVTVEVPGTGRTLDDQPTGWFTEILPATATTEQINAAAQAFRNSITWTSGEAFSDDGLRRYFIEDVIWDVVQPYGGGGGTVDKFVGLVVNSAQVDRAEEIAVGILGNLRQFEPENIGLTITSDAEQNRIE